MTDAEQSKLVFPVCTSVGLTGLAAYFVHYAAKIESGRRKVDLRGLSDRDALFAQMLHAAAKELGLAGAVAVTAVLLAALAGWLFVTVRGIQRARRERALAPPGPSKALPAPGPALVALEPLLAVHVGAWRRQLQLGGLLLSAISVAGGLGLVALRAAANSVGLAIGGFFVGLLMVAFVSVTMRRHPVVTRLVERAHEVTWIWVELAPTPKPAWLARLLRSEPFGWLTVGFFDGRLGKVPLKRGHEAEIARALEAAVGHATHGYTEALRASYEREPRSLLRGAGQGP